jgi:beta-lactamase class C
VSQAWGMIRRKFTHRVAPARLVLPLLLALSSVSARAPDNAKDLQTLDAELRLIMSTGTVPALAIGIVHQGQTIYSRTLGTRSAQNALAIDTHTRFRIASMSKTMSAAVVGKLVHQGFLKWDTPVTLVVPGFRLMDRNSPFMTVAQLMSHQTGLKHHTLDDELEDGIAADSLRALLPKVAPVCRIGGCYAYQNFTFNYATDIVQAASGQFFEHEVQRQLFEPLAMHRANFGLEGLSADDNWARPHVRRWQKGGAINMVLDVKPNYYALPASAGVNASLSDMTEWIAALLGHRPDALPPEVAQELAKIQVVTPAERLGVKWRVDRLRYASYGLGLRVFDYLGHPVYFHAGAVEGYRGMIVIAPA